MSTAPVPPERKPMTAEELMALPDDGVRREILCGELRERPGRFRSPRESATSANLCALLENWREGCPSPRGVVLGQADFRMARDPETFFTVHVSYLSAEREAAIDPDLPFLDGPPTLATLILAPPDTRGEIVERIALLLEAGSVVWEVDPDIRRVTVHRPGHPPEMFNHTRELLGEPYLPGFRVPVARIFE